MIKTLFISVLLIISSANYFNSKPVISTSDSNSLIKYAEKFDGFLQDFYHQISCNQELSYYAFEYAMTGYYNMKCLGLLQRDNIITIIDYNLSSNSKRLYVIDLIDKKIILNSLVAHGRNSGDEMAVKFSNKGGSQMSSIGFFITGETYDGRHEYSLKIDGMESCNSNVRSRGVVFHGADYVDEAYTIHSGRIGRSNGCPALPQNMNRKIVDTIKNGSCVFIFYNDPKYMNNSKFLDFQNAVLQFASEKEELI
ncbi:MAG: murein L,D-transpeptidase catalytic domain family protein [Bacteroidota bacterium]